MPGRTDETVRAQMNATVQAYLAQLPEPRELPEKKEGVERHEIPLGNGR